MNNVIKNDQLQIDLDGLNWFTKRTDLRNCLPVGVVDLHSDCVLCGCKFELQFISMV